MKPIDLTNLEHKNFKFIRPTEHRINNSVAWLVECKHCGHQQLVGSSQVKRGTHASCVLCQARKELETRELR